MLGTGTTEEEEGIAADLRALADSAFAACSTIHLKEDEEGPAKAWEEEAEERTI